MDKKIKGSIRRIIATVFIFTALLILSQWVQASQPTSKATNKTAALLKVDGAIGPATQDYISRGINKAIAANDAVVILQIDTPGGLSKSMRIIIKDILASPVPVLSYVAPSGARAASAGTYILYASHVAAMAPGTNLGAATPVAIGGAPSAPKQDDKKADKKPSASQLKALNDATAYIRSLAQLRGRNAEWAEKAVSQAVSISANEAFKLNVIDFVAKDIPELLKKANGKKVLVRGNSLQIHSSNLTVKEIVPDWRTRFLAVITDPSVAYILLMIGFYGLFFEFVNPGFVLPGVAGAICLLLALYAFQLLPINYAGLGLILLGMAFIVGEAFMPSFGALGIGGVISFAVGSILLLRTDVVGFGLPLKLIFAVTAVTILFFLGVLYLAFKSQRKRVVSGHESMIGKTGVIVIDQQKIWVKVDGELWKAQSSEDLTNNQTVTVVSVQGLTLIVANKE